jgi:hypothetical protein
VYLYLYSPFKLCLIEFSKKKTLFDGNSFRVPFSNIAMLHNVDTLFSFFCWNDHIHVHVTGKK